ncbi:MAG: DUF1428 family protein [Alcaligenaceae bacterium]
MVTADDCGASVVPGEVGLADTGDKGKMAYVDGALLPVPVGNMAAYLEAMGKHAAVLREHGASRVVDAWGDDIPDGKVAVGNPARTIRDVAELAAYGHTIDEFRT